MSELLLKIIPLAIASAASPVIIAVTLALLSKKSFGTLGAFFLGCAVAALILAGIGITFATEDDVVAKSMGFSPSIFDLALGILFLAIGVKIILEKPSGQSNLQGKNKRKSLIKWFAIGLIGSLTNFDAAILNITAIREIFNSGITTLQKIELLALCDFFLLLPILLPCMIYVFAPAASQRVLTPVAVWLKKYGNYIVGVIFLSFGVFLLLK
ncbi:MAG: GAP family protein [Candidatus Micrarchaeia archaeon]